MPSTAAFESHALQRLQGPINVYFNVVDKFGADTTQATVSASLTRADMRRTLQSLHTEAALIGAGGSISSDQRAFVADVIQQDLGYMDGFMDALPRLSRAAALNRCNSYVATLRSTINELAVYNLPPLPMYPQDERLQCGRHCKCMWDIRPLFGAGNWDLYWRMNVVAEHCPDCRRFAARYSPLQIRGGKVANIKSISEEDLRRIDALILIAMQGQVQHAVLN
jgi:hypothetical protein